jgi:hypothetical protein
LGGGGKDENAAVEDVFAALPVIRVCSEVVRCVVRCGSDVWFQMLGSVLGSGDGCTVLAGAQFMPIDPQWTYIESPTTKPGGGAVH